MPPAATKKAAKFYAELLPLSNFLPINKDLSSASENTMVSILGSPKLPLTTACQNSRASDLVKSLKTVDKMSNVFSLTGIKPAVESVKAVLTTIFNEEPDMESLLSTEGMMCVRFRKPTSKKKSTKISNHSWGTAVDFKVQGFNAPANTGQKIPRFISIMLPQFHAAGWFSGIAFHDAMHFEVAEETIRDWSKKGKLK